MYVIYFTPQGAYHGRIDRQYRGPPAKLPALCRRRTGDPRSQGQRLRPWRTAAAGFAGAAGRHPVCLRHTGGSAGAGTAGDRPAASVLRSRTADAAGAVTAAGHSGGGESGPGPGHRRAAHGCAGASGGGLRLRPLRLSAVADGGDEAGIRAGQPAGAGHLLPLPGRCCRAGAVCPVQPGAAGAGRLSRGAAAHRRHPHGGRAPIPAGRGAHWLRPDRLLRRYACRRAGGGGLHRAPPEKRRPRGLRRHAAAAGYRGGRSGGRHFRRRVHLP